MPQVFKNPLEQAEQIQDDDIAYALSEYLDNDPEIDEEGTIEEALRRHIHRLNDGQGVPVERAVKAWVGNSGLTGNNKWSEWLKYNQGLE